MITAKRHEELEEAVIARAMHLWTGAGTLEALFEAVGELHKGVMEYVEPDPVYEALQWYANPANHDNSKTACRAYYDRGQRARVALGFEPEPSFGLQTAGETWRYRTIALDPRKVRLDGFLDRLDGVGGGHNGPWQVLLSMSQGMEQSQVDILHGWLTGTKKVTVTLSVEP